MWHRLRPHPEEGASATLFLLTLFVFLGIAMLAIDVGFVMTSRRGQIADTDSAALAAAQAMIDDRCGNDPTAEATTYVQLNDTTTTVDAVTVTPTTTLPSGSGCEPASGVVDVSTTHQSVLIFAPLFGYNQAPTFVTSGAAYGQITEMDGLRPIGLCASDPHFQREWKPFLQAERSETTADDWGSAEWTAAKAAAYADYDAVGMYPGQFTPEQLHPTARNGTSYPAGAHVHRFVFFSPDAGNSCGQGPTGNFGWLDFDGVGGGDVPHECDPGVSPKNELNCDVNNGFQGLVSLTPPDCDPTSAETKCLSNPGSVASAQSGLESIRCPAGLPATHSSCEVAYIVVYGQNPAGCGGAACAQFELVSVTGLVIRDYKATGAPKTHYIDVEFVDELEVGSIGPVDPSSTAPMGVVLCKVDNIDKCNYGP